ncbi:hypothetical protein [Microbacterium album]|uniref:Uncharacterized protein n=1 Tax=Microbacterium album TaxID=2053191 RepID=A0A917IJD4_9MICO|nr:hypothetical protein [Microbacterium album]GGH51032.1 hypothetical protein GCM10010921_30210 [Microbacterium album]
MTIVPLGDDRPGDRWDRDELPEPILLDGARRTGGIDVPPPNPSLRKGRRLVLLDAAREPERYAGRNRVRQAVLAMAPALDEEAPHIPVRRARPHGVTWAVLGANGITVALRAVDFANPEQAQRDGARALARAHEFTLTAVHDRDRRRWSLWVCLDGDVVLLAGHSWSHRPTPAACRTFHGHLTGALAWGVHEQTSRYGGPLR